jgi:hypothetical protein
MLSMLLIWQLILPGLFCHNSGRPPSTGPCSTNQVDSKEPHPSRSSCAFHCSACTLSKLTSTPQTMLWLVSTVLATGLNSLSAILHWQHQTHASYCQVPRKDPAVASPSRLPELFSGPPCTSFGLRGCVSLGSEGGVKCTCTGASAWTSVGAWTCVAAADTYLPVISDMVTAAGRYAVEER